MIECAADCAADIARAQSPTWTLTARERVREREQRAHEPTPTRPLLLVARADAPTFGGDGWTSNEDPAAGASDVHDRSSRPVGGRVEDRR